MNWNMITISVEVLYMTTFWNLWNRRTYLTNEYMSYIYVMKNKFIVIEGMDMF